MPAPEAARPRARAAVVPLLALLAAPLLGGCFGGEDAPAGVACDAAPPPPDAAWQPRAPRVEVETDVGRFLVELYEERAPVTTANFLDLAASGFYDGTTFHRVVGGFVIQGGDPNTRDADWRNDGLGDPGYSIPDEFNPTLRHDAPGVLSMASRGPDTGGSQFFVTLGVSPQLDDRHSAFGRVVAGLDVVRAIGVVPVDTDDRPTREIFIRRVNETEPRTYEAVHAASVRPVVADKVTEPGRAVAFAVALGNGGNVRDALALHADAPEGWACRVSETPVVAAGTGRVVLLTLEPPADASGVVEIPLRVASAWPDANLSEASVRVRLGTLGEEVSAGDTVTAHYAGLLLDGRLFDTSMAGVAHDPGQPKLTSPGGFQPRDAYEPFTFTVGAGVIEGFSELAARARVGETVTGVIPKEKAYPTGNAYESPLVGRDLVFELEILSIDQATATR